MNCFRNLKSFKAIFSKFEKKNKLDFLIGSKYFCSIHLQGGAVLKQGSFKTVFENACYFSMLKVIEVYIKQKEADK